MIGLIIVIVLLVLLFGSVPRWGYSRNWGYAPSGGLGLILLIVVLLVLGWTVLPGEAWLWTGAALALVLWLPNLVWQVQHGFVSLAFLSAIHARDVSIGRSQGYLPEQLFVSTNPLTVPLWVLGLWFYLFTPAGRQYRLLGWLYVVPFLLFLVVQGRSYYVGPTYPILLSAGAVVGERWLAARGATLARVGRGITWLGLATALAVASNTPAVSGPKLSPSSRSPSGVVATRPAEPSAPSSTIAISQKSRCTSSPTNRILSSDHLLVTRGDQAGERGSYGFVLSAHPGTRGGGHLHSAGSQPNPTRRPAQPAISQSPQARDRPRR